MGYSKIDLSHSSINRYLTEAEEYLVASPSLFRLEILNEIKAQLEVALSSNEVGNYSDLKERVGTPRELLEKTLGARGIILSRPPLKAIVWILPLFFVMCSIGLFWIGKNLFHNFKGAIDFFESSNSIEQLMDQGILEDEAGQFSMNGKFTKGSFKGQENLKKPGRIEIFYKESELEFKMAEGDEFEWQCDGSGMQGPVFETKSGPFFLDLRPLREVHCEIMIPSGAYLQLRGQGGDVVLSKPQYNVDLKMEKGRVSIQPAPDMNYTYNLHVENGQIDEFPKNNQRNPLILKIEVSQGSIELLSNEDEEREK